MSDIWHTADEIPDFNKSYVELSRSVQGDLVYSTWGHPNYITKNTIKWCYMDDLLALETELGRTRKALEYAKDELDVISLKYHKTTPSIILIKYAEHAKAKITALKQKGYATMITDDEKNVADFLYSKMPEKERAKYFKQKLKEEGKILKLLGIIKGE